MGMFVGLIEEGSKLLPLRVRPEGGWRDWKKTVSASLFFGLLEAVFYIFQIAIMGVWVLIPVRLIVLFLHVAWTFIALTVLLVEGKMWGYLLASVLHSLYDIPGLLYLGGISEVYFKAACILGLASYLPAVLAVKKVGEKAVIYMEEERIGIHLPKWFTSSP
ncbi:hypothetical protein [Thermococcus gorgonarius]|nr:hypothetical protein [Thermococcus gorgonarius]